MVAALVGGILALLVAVAPVLFGAAAGTAFVGARVAVKIFIIVLLIGVTADYAYDLILSEFESRTFGAILGDDIIANISDTEFFANGAAFFRYLLWLFRVDIAIIWTLQALAIRFFIRRFVFTV